MLIRLDSKNLHMDILVGVLEKYEPTPEIVDAHNKIEQLKKETNQFIFNKWGETKTEDLVERLKVEVEERAEWEKFIAETYSPKLSIIVSEINEINKRICPGFEKI